MEYKKYDYDSFQIYTIKTDKFKNCYMEINFRDDIRNVDSTKRNFLIDLLAYTSKNNPTKRDMIIAEENLYNLNGSASCYRCGYNMTTFFGMDILNPKYVKESDYLEKCISFCLDIITNPHIENDEWNERSFEIIKERIHAQIDQYKENPTTYAITESKKILFSDSVSSKKLIGTHEEVDAITRKDMVEEYKAMFENAHCDIIIVGNLDMDEVTKIIASKFHKPSIVEKKIPNIIQNKIKEYQEMNVPSKYNQTQLLQYYQFEPLTYFELNFVFPIFRRIFSAGNLSDKLGTYLRMENSLCYNYSFLSYLNDSYAIVSTKLKKENVEKAVSFIEKAYKEMIKGDFTEEEIEIQKNKLLSDLKLKEDVIFGLLDNYYFHAVYNSALFEEYPEELKKVTKESIVKLAKKMHLTFQYVLESEDSDATD